MNQQRIATVTRPLRRCPSRRDVLRGLAASGVGSALARLPGLAAASKRRGEQAEVSRGAARKDLCKKNGSTCRKPGKGCKKAFCLSAPFTVEATFSEDSARGTYLFVPAEDKETGPNPYIAFNCRPEDYPICDEEYPFACVEGAGTRTETATIHKRLPGKYEYWIEIPGDTPEGAVTVLLKDEGGRVARRWANPVVGTYRRAWHVFDVDGRNGSVTSIDELAGLADESSNMPETAHVRWTDVCPSIG